MTAPDTPALVANPTVEVSDVSKWFGQKVAVSGVTCSFGAGLTGLLGPNGAGKTTTMKILTGSLNPSSGRATVGGHDVLEDAVSVRRVLGYLPENGPLYPEMTDAQAETVVAAVRDSLGALSTRD